MLATSHILVMDLNFKSKTWVGSMYQKFEAMCQEVDDFVSQDTVKYVESQVQTVGDSVKRFCSDVVQDLLPGKHEDPVSMEESDAIGTYPRSTINIEEKPLNTDINLASVGQNPIHPLNEQFIHPPSADHIKEAESELSLGQLVNALKYKKEIANEENDTTEELIEKMTHVFVKENNANEELVDKKSDIVVEENGTKKEPSWHEELELIGSSIVVEEDDANEELVDKKSDIIVEENNTKEEPQLICPENKDLSEASLLSESIDEKNDILTEVPAMNVVCHTQKDELSRNSFFNDMERVSDISSTFPPSKIDFSVVLGENKTAEMGLISCSHSSSIETRSMSELSPTNVLHNEENICYNPVDSIGCVSDLSDAFSPSQPFSISSCDNKVSDTSLAFSCRLSLESNAIYTSTTDDASLSGSSKNRHECCYEYTQLQAIMPSLEIGETDDCRVDISDPSMQTIELSEKGKLDESCVIVDSRSLYAFSCGAQKHRSYKKILQDAFASRKRVRKEYEQLAILYGDIDVELSQQQQLQNLLPSIPTLSLDSKKSSFNDLCDADWELL